METGEFNVQSFQGIDSRKLQFEINDYLNQNPKIRPINISISSLGGTALVAMLLYEYVE